MKYLILLVVLLAGCFGDSDYEAERKNEYAAKRYARALDLVNVGCYEYWSPNVLVCSGNVKDKVTMNGSPATMNFLCYEARCEVPISGFNP